MAIIVPCGSCRKRFQIGDQYGGKKIKCPGCGQVLMVPEPEVLEVLPAEEPPPIPVLEAVEDDEDEVEAAEEWSDHGGATLPPNVVFFMPPPPAIGPVLSAYSTLRRGKKPWPWWAMLLAMLAGGLLGLFVGLVLVAVADVQSWFWRVLWPVVGLVMGLVGGYALALFQHTCTYVGRLGVARFQCSGSLQKITREVFCFRDAVDLRTSLVRHYRNGVYQNTAYTYTWSDVGGRVRYKIHGAHTSEAGTPPTKDPYQFALAAQLAWTNYLLNDAHRQLQLAESVRFNLTKGRWVRVGKETLTFCLGGEPVECFADDIDNVDLKEDVLRFRRYDAREGLLTSEGVYKVKVSELANAQLFFHLLDELHGFRL